MIMRQGWCPTLCHQPHTIMTKYLGQLPQAINHAHYFDKSARPGNSKQPSFTNSTLQTLLAHTKDLGNSVVHKLSHHLSRAKYKPWDPVPLIRLFPFRHIYTFRNASTIAPAVSHIAVRHVCFHSTRHVGDCVESCARGACGCGYDYITRLWDQCKRNCHTSVYVERS
jgi:hypothetical protein